MILFVHEFGRWTCDVSRAPSDVLDILTHTRKKNHDKSETYTSCTDSEISPK